MNKTRRKEIERARGMIEEAKAILETCQSEEQDSYDNMPEGLQAGDNGQKVSDAADALQSAVDDCDNIISSIETAIE